MTSNGATARSLTIDRSIERIELRSLPLLLASGGDARIWPDAASMRNKYGTATVPAPGEISFASTTANNISTVGFAAASRAAEKLFGARNRSAQLEDWFNQLRGDLIRLFGIPGSEAILTASGTDAEVVALGIVTALGSRPLTNIYIAPDETGAGIPLAAAGLYFSQTTAAGATVIAGSKIAKFASAGLDVCSIAIRDANGIPRDPGDIDAEAEAAVEQELQRGRDVLLHVLDASKTGLTGVSRGAALRILGRAPRSRVHVVVDSCQLRCNFAQVKSDLQHGFLVIVTGSKFAGGPPYCGAVLLPPGFLGDTSAKISLPEGLAAYSAQLDWPVSMLEALQLQFASTTNIGLGLRWVAALAGLEDLVAVESNLQDRIVDQFVAAVRRKAETLKCIDSISVSSSGLRSIVCLGVSRRDGEAITLDEAKSFQSALRDPSLGPVCHVGQPVKINNRHMLRVAASALDIVGVAARLDGGLTMEGALQPVCTDLDVLFRKWDHISGILR